MPDSDLYRQAISKCRAAAEKRQLQRVVDQTGYSYSWVQKFSKGKMKGASHERVATLAALTLQ